MFRSLFALMAVFASLGTSAAQATPMECGGLLKIVTTSKSMGAANGLEFCLSLIPESADPSKISKIVITGDTEGKRPESFEIDKVRKGISVYKFSGRDVISFAAPGLDAAAGGGATITYASPDGTRDALVMLVKEDGKWVLKSNGKATDLLTLGVSANDRGIYISRVSFNRVKK